MVYDVARHAFRLASLYGGQLLLVLALAACRAGWQDTGIYVKKWKPRWRGQYEEATYRVGLPGSAWSPHHEEHVQVAWHHRDVPALIGVRSQCEEHGDSKIEQFTDHLRIDFREWTVVEQHFLELAGREAVRTTIRGRLDGVETSIETVVMKKNGCLFDFWYMSGPSVFDNERDAFDRVVAGFEFPLRQPQPPRRGPVRQP